MDELSLFLKSEYGITSNAISFAKGGFSTKAAYRAVDANGIEYFVKVYDKFLPTTGYSVDRIEMYMPVLYWLSASSALQGRILTPIPSLTDGRTEHIKLNRIMTCMRYFICPRRSAGHTRHDTKTNNRIG